MSLINHWTKIWLQGSRKSATLSSKSPSSVKSMTLLSRWRRASTRSGMCQWAPTCVCTSGISRDPTTTWISIWIQTSLTLLIVPNIPITCSISEQPWATHWITWIPKNLIAKIIVEKSINKPGKVIQRLKRSSFSVTPTLSLNSFGVISMKNTLEDLF